MDTQELMFVPDTLADGSVRPGRWVSSDRRYVIARYSYWRRDGRTCGPDDRCAPYYRVYTRHDGNSLVAGHTRLESFEHAATVCLEHAQEAELRHR